MEHRASPLTVGIGLAISLLLIAVLYTGCYWWRLPTADPMRFVVRKGPVEFPTEIETVVFRPAVWIHVWVHPDSFWNHARVMVQ
jgi:hypothetical protein